MHMQRCFRNVEPGNRKHARVRRLPTTLISPPVSQDQTLASIDPTCIPPLARPTNAAVSSTLKPCRRSMLKVRRVCLAIVGLALTAHLWLLKQSTSQLLKQSTSPLAAAGRPPLKVLVDAHSPPLLAAAYSPSPPSVAAASTPNAQSQPPELIAESRACTELQSCGACLRHKPKKPPLDIGVRCVWCASRAACLPYLKRVSGVKAQFPCDDAARGGGGYPGGARCRGPSDGGARSLPRAAQAGRGAFGVGTSRGASPSIAEPVELFAGMNVSTTLGPSWTLAELARSSELELLSWESAASNLEGATLLGNGRLGAAMRGGTWRETVHLSEEGLVTGSPVSARRQESLFAAKRASVRSMQQAMRGGDVRAAEHAAATLPVGSVNS